MIEIKNSKIKGQKYRSKFKTFNFLIAILTFTFLLLTSPILAADSTPSADVSTKLKALQTEIASQAAKIKQEIGKKLQNKAFAGFIKSKSASSFTLATRTGTKIVNLNDYTQYSGKGKVTLKSLTTDDFVIALGDVDEAAVLTARKVIKTASPSAEERKVVFGQVENTGERTVTIRDKDSKTVNIKTGTGTTYRFGKEEGSFDEIITGKTIVTVGEISKDKFLQARLIYIFPYTVSIKPKTASHSAGPSTPSAKPNK